MGASTMFDLIGSMFVGGVLLFMAIRMNTGMSQTNYDDAQDYLVQTNLATVVGMVENDMRLVGYCAKPDSFPHSSESFLNAEAHRIRFLADLNSDGKMDTVDYKTGSTSDLAWTPNPSDFPLIRVIGSSSASIRRSDTLNVGLTQFDFAFFNTLGSQLTFPIAIDSLGGQAKSGIFPVQLTILVQNPFGYRTQNNDTSYTYAYWRQLRLSARNLYNR